MLWKKSLTLAAILALGAVLAVGAGCKKDAGSGGNAATSKKSEKGGHEAHHGGCLNAIETCAVGHAEIKVEGTMLKCWFVGGENETGKAVRVSNVEIPLTITTEAGQPQTLTLKAKPLDLAGEKVGDCSCFEGEAAWLAGIKKFDATGQVRFKGQERTLKIEFPAGYDPD